MKDGHLEERLRAWALRRAPEEDDLDRVRACASERLRAEPHLGLGDAPAFPAARIRFPAWAAAAAVALVAFVLLWRADSERQNTAESHNGDALELARIAPEHAAARARLFDETDAVFADRLRWLATIGRDVQVGLVPESGEEGPGSPPLIVRLVVVLKLEGHDDWQPVWSADVLTRSEEFVVIRPRDDGGDEVTLWVDSRDDGRYVVGIRPGPLPVPSDWRRGAAGFSSLANPSRSSAFSRRKGEYRVVPDRPAPRCASILRRS